MSGQRQRGVRALAAFLSDQRAISSVVGTVLMLGITMTVFTAAGVGMLAYFDNQEDPTFADIGVISGSGTYLLTHRGGNGLDASQGHLILTLPGLEVELPLGDPGVSAQIGEVWDIGETICLAGAGAACIYPAGTTVAGAILVYDRSVIMSEGGRVGDPGTVPDLTVTYTGTSPASAVEGESVTFHATVENTGTAVSTPFDVVFKLDAVTVATATIASLGEDATTAVTSSAWTAVQGTMAVLVVVDEAGVISESEESNNQDTGSITVALGVADPNHPYADANCDGVYNPSHDTPIDSADIEDGEHDAGTDCLVIPGSTTPIVAGSILYQGTNLVIETDLLATSGDVDLLATGDLVIDGITVETSAASTDITLSAGGVLSAQGTSLLSDGDLVVTVSGSSVDLTGATLLTTTNNHPMSIIATSGPIDGTGMSAISDGELHLQSAGTLTITNGQLATTRNNYALTISSDQDIVAPGLDVDATGILDIDALGDIDLTSATMTGLNNDDDITVDAGATITLANAKILGKGDLYVTASTGLDADSLDAQVSEADHDMTLDAGAGELSLVSAVLEADDVVWLKGQDINISSADITSGNHAGDMLLTADATGRTITFTGVHLRDSGGTLGTAHEALVSPNPITAVGAPATGAWAYA